MAVGCRGQGLGTALSYTQEVHGSVMDRFQERVRGKDGPGARGQGKAVGRAKETKERPGRPETGTLKPSQGCLFDYGAAALNGGPTWSVGTAVPAWHSSPDAPRLGLFLLSFSAFLEPRVLSARSSQPIFLSFSHTPCTPEMQKDHPQCHRPQPPWVLVF